MRHHLAQFTGSATAQNNFTVNGTLGIPGFSDVSASLADLTASTSSYLTSSGSVDFSDITGKPTLLSSSAQIAAEISGAFTDTTVDLTSLNNFTSSIESEVNALQAVTGGYAITSSISGAFDSTILTEAVGDTTVAEGIGRERYQATFTGTRSNVISPGSNEIARITMRDDFDPGEEYFGGEFDSNGESLSDAIVSAGTYNIGSIVFPEGVYNGTTEYDPPFVTEGTDNNPYAALGGRTVTFTSPYPSITVTSEFGGSHADTIATEIATALDGFTGTDSRGQIMSFTGSGTTLSFTEAQGTATEFIPLGILVEFDAEFEIHLPNNGGEIGVFRGGNQGTTYSDLTTVAATFDFDPDTADTALTWSVDDGAFGTGSSISDYLTHVGNTINTAAGSTVFDGTVTSGVAIGANSASYIDIDLGSTNVNSSFAVTGGTNNNETLVNTDPVAESGTRSSYSFTSPDGLFIGSFSGSVTNAGDSDLTTVLDRFVTDIGANAAWDASHDGTTLTILGTEGQDDTSNWNIAVDHSTGDGNIVIPTPTNDTYGILDATDAEEVKLPSNTTVGGTLLDIGGYAITSSISGAYDSISSSFAIDLTTAIANVSGAFTDTTVDLTSLNNFTSSIQSEVDTIQTFTSSIQSEVDAIQTFTSSIQSEVDALQAVTGGYAITSSISGAFDSVSASFSSRFDNLSDVDVSADNLQSRLGEISGNIILSSSARLIVGTDTSTNIIHAHNSGMTSPSMIQFTNGTTSSGSADGFEVGITGNGTAMVWNNENVPLYFGTNNITRGGFYQDGKAFIMENLAVGSLDMATHSLEVTGVVSASSYLGDGSQLTGIATVNLTSLNNFTSSIQSEVNALQAVTGGYAITSSISGAYDSVSSSFATDLTTAIANVSGAFTDTTVDLTPLNNFTSSIQSEVDTIQTFTSSIQSEVDALQAVTGGYAITSSISGAFDSTILTEAVSDTTVAEGIGKERYQATFTGTQSNTVGAGTNEIIRITMRDDFDPDGATYTYDLEDYNITNIQNDGSGISVYRLEFSYSSADQTPSVLVNSTIAFPADMGDTRFDPIEGTTATVTEASPNSSTIALEGNWASGENPSTPTELDAIIADLQGAASSATGTINITDPDAGFSFDPDLRDESIPGVITWDIANRPIAPLGAATSISDYLTNIGNFITASANSFGDTFTLGTPTSAGTVTFPSGDHAGTYMDITISSTTDNVSSSFSITGGTNSESLIVGHVDGVPAGNVSSSISWSGDQATGSISSSNSTLAEVLDELVANIDASTYDASHNGSVVTVLGAEGVTDTNAFTFTIDHSTGDGDIAVGAVTNDTYGILDTTDAEEVRLPSEVYVEGTLLDIGGYAITSSISGAYDSVSSSFSTTITNIIDGTTTVQSASYAESASYAVSSSITNILAENVTELTVEVRNDSGGTLTKGTPVHVTGVQGTRFRIKAANASVAADMPAIGLLQTDLSNNSNGYAVIGGKLTGINTSAYTEGTNIYVAAGGGLTNTKPTGTGVIQNIGIVGRANASGEIIVMGAGRSNDVPNLATGEIFFGNGNTVQVPLADAITGSLPAGVVSSSAQFTNFGNVTAGGHFIPDVDNTYDLGSTTRYWRDLYLSSGSLYINGNQIISTTGDELKVSTDAGESLKIEETGNDTVTIETVDGDITLTAMGTGNIELDAPIQIAAGKNILSSDGNAISFSSDIDLGSNSISASYFKGDGSQLTGISDTQLSTEQVQDIVGAMFTGNTETRISATYQDGDGTIDLVVTDQSYTLPEATSTVRGGIELFSDTDQSVAANSVSSTAGRTYGIQLNSAGQAVVNVPWSDTNTNTFRTVTAGGNTLGATETLAFTAGTNVTITEAGGAVTINATDTNTQLSTEQVQDIVGAMFTGNTETRISATYQDSDGTIDLVATDQSYTLPEATATTRGGIELFSNTDQSVAANSVSSTAGRTYGIQLNSAGQAVVNVPWTDTDTNTTYSAGTGLDLTSTTFSVDVSDFMTNGANNRLVTATGTDGMNAEANLTFDGTNLDIPQYIRHSGDSDSYFGFGGLNSYQMFLGNVRLIDASTNGIVINEGSADVDFRIESNNNQNMLFVNGGTDRVGIGTNSPTHTLTVNGTVSGSFVGDGSGLTGISSGGSGFPFTGSAGISGSLDVDGPATVTSLTETSTERLKENIVSLPSQTEHVMKLNPVSFDWIESGKNDLGFIAEEVKEIYPEFVKHDEFGNVTGMSYSKLTAILTKVVQEQQEELYLLKNELNELKSKIK